VAAFRGYVIGRPGFLNVAALLILHIPGMRFDF